MPRTKVVASPNGTSVVELTAEENAYYDAGEKAWADGTAAREMEQIRNHRDNLLTKTDWMALGDVTCLLYTSPSPRDRQKSRMPSSA